MFFFLARFTLVEAFKCHFCS